MDLVLRRNHESYTIRPTDTANDATAATRGLLPSPGADRDKHQKPKSAASAADNMMSSA
jgi:hypothetical protein